jgi:putative hydrolase of the HAD superfamily
MAPRASHARLRGFERHRMSETRAIVFDLDNTLYPQEQFTLSGFLAVANFVEAQFGIPRDRAMRTLRRARRARRGRELQELCARFDLSSTIVPHLVSVVRLHEPGMRLPGPSAIALRKLRQDWRIGVLTNGMPSVQRRKVQALGLAPLVDVVLFAEEHGEGGKPHPAPFLAMRERLDVPADRTVFVGDDPSADIWGAHRAGFRTIFVSRSNNPWPARLPAPDARVASMRAVPRAAEDLLMGRGWRHVA